MDLTNNKATKAMLQGGRIDEFVNQIDLKISDIWNSLEITAIRNKLYYYRYLQYNGIVQYVWYIASAYYVTPKCNNVFQLSVESEV